MLISTVKDLIELKKIIESEGNLIEFVYKDIQCVLKRNPLDALCGYCKIPSFVKININDSDIRVHGGITYTGIWDEYDVFEFDCSHSDDFVPLYPFYNLVYRTKDYCIQECQNMVDQIIKLDPKINIYIREKKLERIINI